LVLSLADNKQLLGLRYAEWATRAPTLEADIAAAAMGLDDLGHSRVLYGCLEALGDDPRDAKREVDSSSYRALPFFDSPWETWAQFVAANAVLDTAFSLVIRSFVEGNVEVLQSRLRKMLMEERYHYLHGRSWLREGIDEAPVHEAWRQAIEWFGPPDGELARLHSRHALSMGPAELAAQLSESLATSVPESVRDWSNWDETRRRSRGGAIDEGTFLMLRGLEEGKFGGARA
jgi:1,2-phenylacetyl-CoA epoxidase catalytic subunit